MQRYYGIQCILSLTRRVFKGNIFEKLSNQQAFYVFFSCSHTSGFQNSLMPKNSQFIPPALPPKKQKLSSSNVSLNNIIITPPISPKVSNINELVHDEKQENNEKQTSSADDSRKEKILNEDSRKEDNDVVLRKKPNDMVELECFKLSLY